MDDAAPVLRVGSAHERAGLIRDGLAREVLSGVLIAADQPITAAVRAHALREKLGLWETDAGRGRAVGFGTAAWVHTGTWPGPTAGPIDLVIGRNRRAPRLGGVRVRQVDLPTEHLELLEGLLVTRPGRTAADVARDLPRAHALSVLRTLQELHDVHPPQVLGILASMPYARGAAIAREVVRAWADSLR
jgi:hypothetical protein